MNLTNNSFEFLKQKMVHGSCLYQGIPFTTQETIDLIGQGEIDKIDKCIKEMVKWKRYMFKRNNRNDSGLSPLLKFAHFPSKRIINVNGENVHLTFEDYIKCHRDLAGFLIPDKLKANNFKKLQKTDFYLLEVSNFPISPSDFKFYLQDYT